MKIVFRSKAICQAAPAAICSRLSLTG